MHFVFISSLVPVVTPTSGYDIANRVIVDALRLLGHQVSVIGFLAPGHEPSDLDATRLLGRLEVTNARVSGFQKVLWLKDAFLHKEPVSVAKMHAARPADIRAVLDGLAGIDGLFLNSVQLPGAFLDIFRAYPYAFVAHNVEAHSAAENARLANGAVARFLYARDARLLARLEADLCAGARHVYTLAEADRSGLDVEAYSSALPLVTSVTPPDPPQSGRKIYDAGVIGSWSWASNRAGLDWFLGEVAPRLPADIRLAVAGGGADAAAAPASVDCLGRVPDAREFVRSCRVIPLIARSGTGVQLKTIETFELGLPAVATPAALRGISDIPENCVTADAPAEFAAALTEQIRKARAGEVSDGDGRQFHARQLKGLKQSLAEGLCDWPPPHG